MPNYQQNSNIGL